MRATMMRMTRPGDVDPLTTDDVRCGNDHPGGEAGPQGTAAVRAHPTPRPSQNLLDEMHRSLSADFADADGKQTIEERVVRRGGLETAHGAEIVVRVVAHAGECHVNQAAIVGLERDPQ